MPGPVKGQRGARVSYPISTSLINRGSRSLPFAHTCNRFVGRSWTSGLWEVKGVKDMRVVKGAREWLVCWAGTDRFNKPWKPSWEPVGGEGTMKILKSLPTHSHSS